MLTSLRKIRRQRTHASSNERQIQKLRHITANADVSNADPIDQINVDCKRKKPQGNVVESHCDVITSESRNPSHEILLENDSSFELLIVIRVYRCRADWCILRPYF